MIKCAILASETNRQNKLLTPFQINHSNANTAEAAEVEAQFCPQHILLQRAQLSYKENSYPVHADTEY